MDGLTLGAGDNSLAAGAHRELASRQLMHLLQQLAASSTSSAGEVADLLQLHRQAMDAEQDDRLQLMAQVMCHCPSIQLPSTRLEPGNTHSSAQLPECVLYWDRQS